MTMSYSEEAYVDSLERTIRDMRQKLAEARSLIGRQASRIQVLEMEKERLRIAAMGKKEDDPKLFESFKKHTNRRITPARCCFFCKSFVAREEVCLLWQCYTTAVLKCRSYEKASVMD